MSLTAKVQTEIMDSLYESAATLAEGSNGLFCAYEPNPNRFGYQTLSPMPSHYRIDGRPIEDVDVSDMVAANVDPRYEGLPSAITKYDEETSAFSQMGHVLKSGQNVGLGMGHAELIDIALFEVGVSNHFRRQGIRHRSILVASKAMDFLGVEVGSLKLPEDVVSTFMNGLGIEIEPDNTVPVRKFLELANDHTYLTIPATKTFSRIRGAQNRGIKLFNRLSTSSLAKELDRANEGNNAPALLGVALPGTTVKELDIEALSEDQRRSYGVEAEQRINVIGRINPSIRRFTGEVLMYATEVRLGSNLPEISVDKDFVCIKDEEDVFSVASKLVIQSAGLDMGKYIYDELGNLPVIRK